MLLAVNYVPLSDRWATLSLVVAIACGASAMSLLVDERVNSKPAESLAAGVRTADIRNPWSVQDGASEEDASEEQSGPEQIVVVNPDGSVRKTSGGLAAESYEGEELTAEGTGEPRYGVRSMSRTSAWERPAGRIE